MSKLLNHLANRNTLTVFLSVILAILFVTLAVEGASTISTNITTGGTLNADGATTLNGNVTLGDASTDVNLFTGALHASTTALFTSGFTTYGNLTVDKSATTTVSFNQSGINFDSNTFVIDPNANRVGVLTATPNTTFEVVGTASSTSLVVGGGTSISKHISASASLDFPVIDGSGCQTLTITANEAADGDTVSLGVPDALASTASTTFSGWVSAANTVTVRACNVGTSNTADPAAATVRADVWKH